MKADLIIKNARIYTVDSKQPWAEAMAVKDGKLVYVGSNEGIKDFEGPVKDAKGQFIMPGIIDPHTHIGLSSGTMRRAPAAFITANSKAEALAFIRNEILSHPDEKEYNFYLNASDLHGERLKRDELDEMPTKAFIKITEGEHHSCWVNTPMLKKMGIGEYDKDIAPGLSFFERDDDGRVNGRIYEFCQLPKQFPDYPDDLFEDGLDYVFSYWKKWGVIAAFDAGQPGAIKNVSTFFRTLSKREKEGKLPYYIEACHYLVTPESLDDAVAVLKKFNEEFSGEIFKVRTMKMMLDGTFNGRTAAIFDSYSDCSTNGGTLVSSERLGQFLIELNNAGIDFHVHTVGERAVVTVLDGVEYARKQLGDKFTIQVTCAHIETLPDEHLSRFASLGVIANFTPHWFGGNCVGTYEIIRDIIGEKRASHMYRANTIWNTGALVCFSSDYVAFDNMKHWNPYMGIEVGITHQDNILPAQIEDDFSACPVFPPEEEKLSMAQLIKGFTINAAKQMRLDDKIGSLEKGKDASFLVFEKSLFEVDKYQIHKQLPKEVYIKGKLQ